ncbi:MAG: TetR/AcrR family transcriptional regulator [Pseudomonadota bacterium]
MTMTIQKKDGYHHGDLRQALVDATRSLIEENGPHGFSVSEACRRAGVSTAAPYRHFADRNAMMREVCLQGMNRMAEQFLETLKNFQPGTIEALTAIGLNYISFAEREPQVFRMMFAADEGEGEEIRDQGLNCYGIVLGQVAQRMGRTEIDIEVERATFPLWTFVHGLAFLRIDGKMDATKTDLDVASIIENATRRLLS